MEQSSEVDIDWLLQSDDSEDFTVSDHHLRTVDEIILNHSSPSPPSSPSFLRRASSIESDSYNSNIPAVLSKDSSRTNYTTSVLPHLFGAGVIRSMFKPGAALEAAAAASRSIPTPHAVAIKLKKASASAISEPKTITTATDGLSFSPSSLASKSSQFGSEAGTDVKGLSLSDVQSSSSEEEYEGLKIVRFQSAEPDSVAEIAVSTGLHPSEQNVILADEFTTTKTTMEVDNMTKVLGNIDSKERQSSVFEYGSPSLISDSKNSVLDDVRVVSKDVFPASVFDEGTVPVGLGDILTADGNGYTAEKEMVSEPEKDFMERGSDTGSLDSIKDILPQQDDRENAQKLQNSHSSLRSLDLAEEIEKKQAFAGLHYVEGAAAQPMRLEGVQRSSAELGYFDVNANNTISQTLSTPSFSHEHGSPQVVAVHLNCIAIGMSKGSVFVVPSKYTSQYVDNMNSKMTFLGVQDDRSNVSVTSMCFNQQGDLLFAGYADGHYTVWDVQKASALRVVTEHRAPVVHLLYLGQDSHVTRQFNVVSGDNSGVVKLIKFKVSQWLNRISYTYSGKLWDETTGRVLCASPLLYGECHGGALMSQGSNAVSSSGSSINNNLGGVDDESVFIFITQQSALVTKVSPTVKVYAQIPRPEGVSEGSMPYAALRCVSQIPGSSENASTVTLGKTLLLAIAWDKKIQVATVLNSELRQLEKWSIENPAIGVAWLNDEMLVVLTVAAQLYLFANDGNVINLSSFAIDGYPWDDLISYHTYFSNASGKRDKAYHNCVSVRGATVYILGRDHLVVSRLLSWKERIEVLRKSGDWIGALNMSLMLYHGQSNGFIDLPKNLDDVRTIVMPFMVELIQSYVSEVFSYMSLARRGQNGLTDQSDDIKEQYISIGEVAVEFCVHIRRIDILFDDILSKFEDANNKDTFLELLEPYILKDMLGSVPPEVMQELVEHYSKRGWLQRIEQCVLRMDILSLDFNQVVRLCREHELHGALIYLFNKGLDDFRTPLEELLTVIQNTRTENASSLGYRMLVYLKYCFQGVAFPPGRGDISPIRLPSLREELLQFLLETSSSPNAPTVRDLESNDVYINLLYLLKLDTEATLDVLNCAFTEDNLPASTHYPSEHTSSNIDSAETQNFAQNIVDILVDILDDCDHQPDIPLDCNDGKSSWPSKKDVGHMYEYVANYVATERANISKDILGKIFNYLTSEVYYSDAPRKSILIFKRRENQLLSLLEAIPQSHWDAPSLLHLCEKAQFHRACGHILSISHQNVAALSNYMEIVNEPVHAFSFIHDMLLLLNGEEHSSFTSAVISHIPGLVKLSREGAYFLIANYFSEKMPYILSELHSHPESLFLYLKTSIEVRTTGTLNLSSLDNFDTVDLPGARKRQQQSIRIEAYLNTVSNSLNLLGDNEVHVTDKMMELYFELLCQYDRGSVLKFLETSESYRVEHCLRLCQEYGIVDAASFLFERVGEVGSALSLVLSFLNDKFVALEFEIQKRCFDTCVDQFSMIMKEKVVTEIFDIVHTCIGLCQRNSPRMEPDESEHLWFELLDSFFDPLIHSSNARISSLRKGAEIATGESFGIIESEDKNKVQWKVLKTHKGGQMMRKLFSLFIKEIVEGMIGYVRLSRIMLKLLSDTGNQEFGDFKLTILGMLGTYDFERKILDTAKTLIEDDTYYIMSLLRKGASHGYTPRSLVCCICNTLLLKTSDSSIQVFSCGHAIHGRCEFKKTEESHWGTFAGCPICNFRKKSVGKSMFEDNGLVRKSSLGVEQAGGMPTLPPHDHSGFENPYFSHPSSRFELLNNLQNDKKFIHVENSIHLRLAPPDLYHEKVKKRTENLSRESTSSVSSSENSSSRKKSRDVKMKGSLRSTLKTNIFREFLHPIGS